MALFRYVGTAALIAKAKTATLMATNEALEDLVGQAMNSTPVDTGTLKASIHTDGASIKGNEISGQVSTGGEANEYAFYVHEGTSKMGATPFILEPLTREQHVYKQMLTRAWRGAF